MLDFILDTKNIFLLITIKLTGSGIVAHAQKLYFVDTFLFKQKIYSYIVMSAVLCSNRGSRIIFWDFLDSVWCFERGFGNLSVQ